MYSLNSEVDKLIGFIGGLIMAQKTFGALWDYAEQIESGRLTLEQASKYCRHLRDEAYRQARKFGRQATRFSLSNQLRQYWRFGVPCGLSCTCYGVNIQE